MAEREVRYCTTDDSVRIAYCLEGKGPALLVCPNFVESFSVDHLDPWGQSFRGALAERRMLVRYDHRGVGLSQRVADDRTVSGLFKDIEAVVDAVGLERFSVLAIGTSVPAAILLATRYEDRVDCLILSSGWARVQDGIAEEALRALADLARANWDVAAQAMVSRVTSPAAEEALAEMYRRSTTGESVARLILANINTDVSDALERVAVPTLVANHTNNNLVPFSIAQGMAIKIPGARRTARRFRT